MYRSTGSTRRTRVRAAGRRQLGAGLGAVTAAAVLSGVALAATGTRVVGEASNTTLKETIVVDTHGRTLYALHPETTHHLLCKSHACLETWPPLTVHSANVKLEAAHGVEGHLALLRRSGGKLQVTLRGAPLYRFAGDSAKGQANGEGIKAFGGTWHAVKAELHATATPSPAMPPAAPPMTPGYGY
jgi:predicted lipoprotein with Yx(FWY)xxD motif